MSNFLPEDKRKTSVGNTKFKKNEFLYLSEGVHTIRVLDERAVLTYIHWIKGSIVKCLGEDCPICQANSEVLASVNGDWDEARKVSGFYPYQKKYYINVLDRTQVKVCPSCGTQIKSNLQNRFPMSCTECGASIAVVQETESNKVKILNGGVTMFDDLASLNETVTKPTGEYYSYEVEDSDSGESVTVREEIREPIGITNFDIALRVRGSGLERQTAVMPQEHRNDEVTVDSEDLFDLNNVVPTLTASEMGELRRGVSLRDIFVSRNAERSVEEVENTTKVDSFAEDMQSRLNGMLDGRDN